MVTFDAAIDIRACILPVGISPADSVDKVRAAVEALPGAGWISVEWCGDAPPSLIWLRIYAPGAAAERNDGEFGLVRSRIETAVAVALAASTCP